MTILILQNGDLAGGSAVINARKARTMTLGIGG